jgi:outer membrane lipoprotein-sorting protein
MDPLEDDLMKLARRLAGDDASADGHRDSLRQAALAAFDEAPILPPAIQPKKRYLVNPAIWSTIMRHPASRIAILVMFAVAAIGIFWLLGSGAAHVAYAHLVEPLLKAKTATFTITIRVNDKNEKDVPIGLAFVSGSALRIEMSKDGNRQINITDAVKGQSLSLDPQTKQAMLTRTTGAPVGGQSAGMLEEIRQFLTPSNDQTGITRESLGERQVDARKLVGYRVASPVMTVEVWGDPKTLLPELLIQRMAAFPSVETRMSDFQFDVKLDPSLFSLDPPDGYQVTEQKVDVSPSTENDLMSGLREYAKLSGGLFPDALNSETAIAATKIMRGKTSSDPPTKDEQSAASEAENTMRRGFAFPLFLGPETSAHYAGKGVELDAKDRPILLYKPKGAKTYRVVYADLTVGESDNPPNLPGAMPIGNTQPPPK